MKKILILLALCIPISGCMITGINNLYRIIPVENQSYEIVSYFEKKKKYSHKIYCFTERGI